MRAREIRLGNIWGATGGSFAGMVYDQQVLSPSITTMGGGADSLMLYAVCLRYERNDYAKKIRKAYEGGGALRERRCNLRTYGIRSDGCCNTISTVQKDCLICVKHST